MQKEPSVFDRISDCCQSLKVDLTSSEMAVFADSRSLTQEQLDAVAGIFDYLEEKKRQTVIETLLRLSRLPLKVPKTFDNFNFDRIQGRDSAAVRNLPSLTEVQAGKNIALIGPPGVGKTHLAQAYARACCLEGLKGYFLKASELKEKFTSARKTGREANIINGLVKPSCLIIDEIGRCIFDRESTGMFFDLIDRRYEKEGTNCMIFTSNKQPNDWLEFFRCDDDDFGMEEGLVCAGPQDAPLGQTDPEGDSADLSAGSRYECRILYGLCGFRRYGQRYGHHDLCGAFHCSDG